MSADEQHSVKAGTEYVVLGSEGPGLWQTVAQETARSAEAAIRQYVISNSATSFSSTFVAVPTRNWNPLKVTPRTVTTLEIEKA